MDPELQILPAIVFLLLYQEHVRRRRRQRVLDEPINTMGLIMTLAGGGGRPPGSRPPNYRAAVKRPRRVLRVFPWAGGRFQLNRPPAQGKTTFPRGCRLVIEPAEWEGATGATAPVAYFTVCKADSEIHFGALLRGPLPCPCHWHGHGRGPQGPRDPPYRHPVHGGFPAMNWMAVGGVRILMAAERAPQPWRIPMSSGKSAGDR
ncbi:hypothetical protein NDU88_002618 [Pleurodeles waltl]|uniref:Uncharacterized protein n=2 Tax=Pleurodeles waltl TaxID=8319 RepID=A0AAV7T328_PLEWA|nr:hypothetical protein NDU88_002618 [Pleurodeles waltl]